MACPRQITRVVAAVHVRLARSQAAQRLERGVIPRGDRHQRRRRLSGQGVDECALDRPVDGHVEQHHRHPPQQLARVASEGTRGDLEQRRAIRDLAVVEPLVEPSRKRCHVARRRADLAQRVRRHAAQPQFRQRRRQRSGKSGKPRDRREVAERMLPQRFERRASRDRLCPQRRRRRHAQPRHLRRRQPHRELSEARAVHPKHRSARRGDPPREIVRRVARGADQSQLGRGGETLDEGNGGADAFGGRGGGKHFEHRGQS